MIVKISIVKIICIFIIGVCTGTMLGVMLLALVSANRDDR